MCANTSLAGEEEAADVVRVNLEAERVLLLQAKLRWEPPIISIRLYAHIYVDSLVNLTSDLIRCA